MSDDDQMISYPVREVLDRMDARLERIEVKLDHKADKADVAELDGRVKVLEVEKATREKAREVNAEHRQRAGESRRANWAIWLAGLAAAGAVAEAIITGIH